MQNFRLDVILNELGSSEESLLIKIYVTISQADNEGMRRAKEKERLPFGRQPAITAVDLL